jgi:hypothetical protein
MRDNHMFYKLEKSEYGECRDKNGVRYTINECGMSQSKAGTNVGYTFFETRSAALAFYGVEDIPEEEMFPMEEVE